MHISSRLGAEGHLHSARGRGGYGVTCPRCRQAVELTEEGVCPVCGHRAARAPLWKTLIFYFGAMVFVLLVGYAVLLFL